MNETITMQTLLENPEKDYRIVDDRNAKFLMMQLGILGRYQALIETASQKHQRHSTG